MYILLLVLLLALPTIVFASAGQPQSIPSWEQFLLYLSAPSGVSAAVGIVLSLAVDNVPQYVALGKKAKRLIFFGISFALPVLAALLGSLTANWGWGWDAVYWPAIVAGFLAGGIGTLTNVRKYFGGANGSS